MCGNVRTQPFKTLWPVKVRSGIKRLTVFRILEETSGVFMMLPVLQFWLNVIIEQKWELRRVMSRLAANPHIMRETPEGLLLSQFRKADMWQPNVQHYHCHIHFLIHTWDLLFFCSVLSKELKNKPVLSFTCRALFFFFPKSCNTKLGKCKTMQLCATLSYGQACHRKDSE